MFWEKRTPRQLRSTRNVMKSQPLQTAEGLIIIVLRSIPKPTFRLVSGKKDSEFITVRGLSYFDKTFYSGCFAQVDIKGFH